MSAVKQLSAGRRETVASASGHAFKRAEKPPKK